MKSLVFSVAAALMFVVGAASAQEPQPALPIDPELANITPSPTESMWFYVQQQRRYDDPWQMIRRREQTKAEQRRHRLAAMKWYGFSPSRPIANPTPFTGIHAPSWVGNGHHPYQWIGGGYSTAIHIDTSIKR